MTFLRLVALVVFLAVPGLSFAQIEPYPEAPACASHNDRAWHGLWNADIGCHYDHQHGDDPSSVNDIFGASLFDVMGGTISHPWQTFSAAGLENDLKHAGYFWHVRRDLPCPTPGCITAFRVLVHQHPSGRDAAVRHHSAAFEFQMRNASTGQTAIVQVPGMWVDFGELQVDGVRIQDIPDAVNGAHKQHGSTGTPQIIWYGASPRSHGVAPNGSVPRGFATISTSVHDVWDFTQPSNPSDYTDVICPQVDATCTTNATTLRPHLLAFNAAIARRVEYRHIFDPNLTGRVNGTFWFDRYLVPQPLGSCATASLDCVPVTFTNVETIQYSCDQPCAGAFRDHDIYASRNRSMAFPRPVP